MEVLRKDSTMRDQKLAVGRYRSYNEEKERKYHH